MPDEHPAFAPPTTSPSYDDPQGFRRRRRFVRDGEVMVERAQLRADLPQSNAARLPQIEAALRDSQARQGRQERLLEETKATITSLRTQLAHAEIAMREAQQVASAERAKAVAAQAELLDLQTQIEDVRAQAETASEAREAREDKATSALREARQTAAAEGARAAAAEAALRELQAQLRDAQLRDARPPAEPVAEPVAATRNATVIPARDEAIQAAEVPAPVPERRRPGRPRKVPLVATTPAAAPTPTPVPAPVPERRKPGRPRKWLPPSDPALRTTRTRSPAPRVPAPMEPQPQPEPVRWWEDSWKDRF